MINSSRRDLLLAAGGFSAVAKLGRALESGPHLDFPSAPRQRLAVTSYPFRALIESPANSGRDRSKPGMDLKEFPAMIAKRFGVYNINPLGSHLSSTDPAYLDSFRKAVADAKSHLVDLGLGGKDFQMPNSQFGPMLLGTGANGSTLRLCSDRPAYASICRLRET